MMQVMATLYESVEGVPYTPKDMANFRSKLRAENKYTDMQDTMAYFEDLKSRDKDFYYRYKLDDEDCVQYLFWVDSAARKAYKNYNNCISFDATYMTNKYKMPFAPFIGINNHGQSIQLGCGFLKNELTESYIWLFESFLIAMDGVAPVNIITDQDGAMRAGIEKMFPNTTHRNCRWHIVDKATEEISPFVAKIPGLREEMNHCINFSLTPQEFETRWNLMIQTFNTTQRSEGFNAVLKKYISPANSVLEFVLQYADIQAKIMKAEKKEEADSSLLTAKSWCWHPIEQQMEKLYTKNIHTRFQYEMSYTMSYNIRQVAENTYEVYCITHFVPNYHNSTYQVYANPPNANHKCTCCKFERDGIVCCHILKAMVQLGVCQMPLSYVLRRWTWSAEENLVEELPGQPAVMPEESKKKMWLAVMCNEFKGLALCGNETEDGRKIIWMHMKSMKKDLASLKRETEKRAKKASASSDARKPTQSAPAQTTQNDYHTQQVPPEEGPSCLKPRQTNRQKKPTGPSSSTNPAVRAMTVATTNATEGPIPTAAEQTSETSEAPNIRDPRVSNTKGRKRKKAYQKPLDIGRKEVRVCKQCGSTQHDLRMCPQRGELPVQN
ncbi:hypothetical protein ACQ4PT_059395 [Festuca glaucescens]